jgi:hypothetical protein
MIQETNNSDSKGFKFDRRFWTMLAISYVLFLLLVILPFLLGYINSTIVFYGIAGIIESLILMVIVWRLNRVGPLARKRIGYVVFGGWLGLLIGVVFGIILFGHQIIAAIGSWPQFFIVIVLSPLVGSLIGYLGGKGKYSNQTVMPHE